jgi:alpha/beta hydrolase fold
VEGIMLFHPWFGGSEPITTDKSHMKSRFITNVLWKYAYPISNGIDDLRLNPMAKDASSLLGLNYKRMLVCWAGKDGLKEWQKAYYEAVKKSGWKGEVELCETEGEDHCFHIETPGKGEG